jgi:hypothetical protein
MNDLGKLGWAMRSLVCLIVWLSLGCVQSNPPEPPPGLDFAFFRCELQPVLVKQCATPACHGNGKRFFRLYARNRLRLGVSALDVNRPLREEEVRANYDASRALVDSLDRPEDSMMLRKPLESSQGGYYHGATRIFRSSGANVFASPEDPGYQKLLSWAEGTRADPSCLDPGRDEAP